MKKIIRKKGLKRHRLGSKNKRKKREKRLSNLNRSKIYQNLKTQINKNKFLASKINNWRNKKKYVKTLTALLNQKIGDFDGKPFVFPFSPDKKCYYRCLAFQQSMAMLQAEEKGWISKEEVNSPSMWSDLADEKIASVSSWIDSRAKELSTPIEVQD